MRVNLFCSCTLECLLSHNKSYSSGGQVVSVLTIRVRIPLKSTVLFCNVFEKNEKNQKEAVHGPFQ